MKFFQAKENPKVILINAYFSLYKKSCKWQGECKNVLKPVDSCWKIAFRMFFFFLIYLPLVEYEDFHFAMCVPT